ncbi:glycosyltransferase family 39 protein [Comamonas sp. JUb58]|uniref:ArnT family glycosyltransferase n=1 Tax=Comamonas sp. JUb58 TaxID=2485114 RepID=UPI00105EF5CF|nr:glycosyltransferase family 39 protein [Comamonas sp. JUb58]TDS69696.1 dolichyl-phosphate-mannose-protein mannosyltransferase [Comamonas sp. JUb58]
MNSLASTRVAPARFAWTIEASMAVLVAVWLLALAWVRPLSDPDEGRYAVAALQMLRSGDWVTPALNGLPFFHKPPLYYWLAATGFQLAGVHEWVARLPSLLGAWLAAMSLFVLLKRYASQSVAVASAVVLVTMPYTYMAAQYANMDMLLAGCLTACICSAAMATLEVRQANGRIRGLAWMGWLAAAGVWAGLGFLAKGLIALVLPGMVWAIWLVWERRWRQWWLPLHAAAWLPVLLIAGPWVFMAQQRHGGFFHYFFVTQHFQRYTGSSFNNPQPWWFYVAVIALAALPWTGWALAAAWRNWRREPLAGSLALQAARPAAQPLVQSLDRLMLVWFAVIVLFFSVPHSKIVGYVLPALPPLAYAVVRLVQAAGWQRWGRHTAALAALLCVVLAVVLGTVAVPSKAQWRALRSLPVQSADRLVMLEHMYYEVPFYLPAMADPLVVDDWRSEGQQADNWKKELSDAAEFAPQLGNSLLLDARGLQAYACAHPQQQLWVVGSSDAAQRQMPSVAAAAPALHLGSTQVWQLQGGQACGKGTDR